MTGTLDDLFGLDGLVDIFEQTEGFAEDITPTIATYSNVKAAIVDIGDGKATIFVDQTSPELDREKRYVVKKGSEEWQSEEVIPLRDFDAERLGYQINCRT